MKAYKYSTQGVYIGVVECQIDPLETRQKGETVYLLPKNATYIEPPKAKEGYNIVWDDAKWTYVEIPAEPEPEPHIPTTDEKLAALDSEYESAKADIFKAYQTAVLMGDTDLQTAIQADFAELNADYAEERAAIING